MQNALKHSYVLISAYNLLAFPACPPALAHHFHPCHPLPAHNSVDFCFYAPSPWSCIHQRIYPVFIKWEKRHKVFPNPALGFGSKSIQAIREVTARKILLRPVALDWNKLSGYTEMADEEWNQCSGMQGAKNTKCKQILWAATVEASNYSPLSASELFAWLNGLDLHTRVKASSPTLGK